MSHQLPRYPNLDHLKRQAKDLLKAYRASNAQARQLFEQHRPRPTGQHSEGRMRRWSSDRVWLFELDSAQWARRNGAGRAADGRGRARGSRQPAGAQAGPAAAPAGDGGPRQRGSQIWSGSSPPFLHRPAICWPCAPIRWSTALTRSSWTRCCGCRPFKRPHPLLDGPGYGPFCRCALRGNAAPVAA
jgi:hypothetical protein